MWATAKCTTGREARLAAMLAQRGREIYYPLSIQYKRPARKRKPVPVQVPAIPGYVFIRKSSIGNAEELRRMQDFNYFLQHPSGMLKILTEDHIQWMRDHLGGAEKPSEKPIQRFKLFQRVRVPEGPFGGLEGIVTGICKREVWVKIDGLDYPVLFPCLLLEGMEV